MLLSTDKRRTIIHKKLDHTCQTVSPTEQQCSEPRGTQTVERAELWLEQPGTCTLTPSVTLRQMILLL